MDTGSNAPGTRPVNFVFCSGDAQPLKLDGTDRRFWIVDAAKAVPVEGGAGERFDATTLADESAVTGALLASAPVTLHPSRSAPKCRDCKHLARQGFYGPRCTHPRAPVDATYGEPTLRPEYARSSKPNSICGLEARLFEPVDRLA